LTTIENNTNQTIHIKQSIRLHINKIKSMKQIRPTLDIINVYHIFYNYGQWDNYEECTPLVLCSRFKIISYYAFAPAGVQSIII